MVVRSLGKRPGLNRERIAAAAVGLVDRDGLESFGVRRLAAELGVDPMSIYNHIPGKVALLDAISEAVLEEAAARATTPPVDWEEVARWMAHGYRDMAMRHPRVFPLLTTRSQTSPVALAALERLSMTMRRAGLPDQVIADAPLTLFGFLNGYLLAVLSPRLGVPDADMNVSASLTAFDPTAYPAMASLGPLQLDFGSRDHFNRMLEIVLAGIRQQGAATPTSRPVRSAGRGPAAQGAPGR